MWTGDEVATFLVFIVIVRKFGGCRFVVPSTCNVNCTDELLFSLDLGDVDLSEDFDCSNVGKWKNGTWFNEGGVVTCCVLEGLEVSDDCFSLQDSSLKVFDGTLN